MSSNYDKLRLGATLASMDGDNNNHGDCFNYGSIGGCDENCPALNECRCEIYKDVEDFIVKTSSSVILDTLCYMQ